VLDAVNVEVAEPLFVEDDDKVPVLDAVNVEVAEPLFVEDDDNMPGTSMPWRSTSQSQSLWTMQMTRPDTDRR